MKTLPFLLGLLFSVQAYACDCSLLSNPKSYLNSVDFVFTGRVVELVKVETKDIEIPEFMDTVPELREQWWSLYKNDFYYARVVVLENIKGTFVSTDTLLFVSEFTNCDPTYELNQSYLFFADHQKNGRYMMTQCTPWRKLEDSQNTILELKN